MGSLLVWWWVALWVWDGSRSTAWDSEIESLTSLIKLHQNERRSAPCGQIGAATQPPELATSPILKKFWVARAFEVRWACTGCHDRTGFNCCLLPLTHFSLFFVSLASIVPAGDNRVTFDHFSRRHRLVVSHSQTEHLSCGTCFPGRCKPPVPC